MNKNEKTIFLKTIANQQYYEWDDIEKPTRLDQLLKRAKERSGIKCRITAEEKKEFAEMIKKHLTRRDSARKEKAAEKPELTKRYHNYLNKKYSEKYKSFFPTSYRSQSSGQVDDLRYISYSRDITEPELIHERWQEWIKYTSRESHYCTTDAYFCLKIPHGYELRHNILSIDNIITLVLGEPRKIKGVVIYEKAYIITNVRKYDINLLRPCVLMIAGDFAAHEETVEKCAKTIKRKIAAQKRKAEKLAELQNGIITAETYQKLTGACTAGTNAWLTDHNLTRADKMTAAEFWEKFKNESFFGREKFREYFGF